MRSSLSCCMCCVANFSSRSSSSAKSVNTRMLCAHACRTGTEIAKAARKEDSALHDCEEHNRNGDGGNGEGDHRSRACRPAAGRVRARPFCAVDTALFESCNLACTTSACQGIQPSEASSTLPSTSFLARPSTALSILFASPSTAANSFRPPSLSTLLSLDVSDLSGAYFACECLAQSAT